MYIENRSSSLNKKGRIGRVTFPKSGHTVYFDGLALRQLKGGYKANHYDLISGDEYRSNGPKKAGGDRVYGSPGGAIY